MALLVKRSRHGSRLAPWWRGPRAVLGSGRPGAVFLAGLLALPAMAFAEIITVRAGCTLTDAITAANADAETGQCPAGSEADEIRLTGDVTLDMVDNDVDGPNALPSITTEITVEGKGFAIARGSGLETPDFRIFHVASTGTLVLRDLIVANGYLNPVFLDQLGGAIFNASGTLILDNSRISGSQANSGGGIYQEDGTLLLIRSAMAGNLARFSGGAIHQEHGTVTVTDSTLSGNSALTGAGLSNLYGEAILTNSTVSGNSARHGGGIRNYVGTVTLTNCTLCDNTADLAGGAILTFLPQVTLTNTIVADSPRGGNCAGGVVNAGNNLSDDATCGTIADSLTGLEAELLDNGGSTMTHALLSGGSAIDAGSALDCPPADQRGAARVGNCDIGAFEYVPCPDLVLSGEIVYDTEIRENCQAIRVGPDFRVVGTGDLTIRAGKLIVLDNTTSVDAGGRLRLEIRPDLQLAPAPAAPLADFTMSGTSGSTTVTFVNTSRGQAPVDYEWDFFNDGIIDSVLFAPPPYAAPPGVFTVTLTVRNALGVDTLTRVVSLPFP